MQAWPSISAVNCRFVKSSNLRLVLNWQFLQGHGRGTRTPWTSVEHHGASPKFCGRSTWKATHAAGCVRGLRSEMPGQGAVADVTCCFGPQRSTWSTMLWHVLLMLGYLRSCHLLNVLFVCFYQLISWLDIGDIDMHYIVRTSEVSRLFRDIRESERFLFFSGILEVPQLAMVEDVYCMDLVLSLWNIGAGPEDMRQAFWPGEGC